MDLMTMDTEIISSLRDGMYCTTKHRYKNNVHGIQLNMVKFLQQKGEYSKIFYQSFGS
jgi:hypothetical protein